MVHDEQTDPVEQALDRSPWCVVIPIEGHGWEDPDIHGPFATAAEAKAWALNYPGADVRHMCSPEFVILCHRDRQESDAYARPHH